MIMCKVELYILKWLVDGMGDLSRHGEGRWQNKLNALD